MAKIFVPDPFILICFPQDSEKYIEEESNICILTSYKHNQDVLELKEKELILLHVEIQQTGDVHTLAEITEQKFLLLNIR